jgi:hypothetical protein
MSDMYTKQQNLDMSDQCVPKTDISIHDDLLVQSEREGWRYAKECEAEIERLKDLNKRLVAAAKELGYADDTHEWDDAWSKLFAIITENVSDNNGKK